MALGLILGGLGSLAGSFVRDLVTGKKAGSTLSEIGSSAMKSIKSLGEGVVKGAKRIFGAGSFGEAVSAAGSVGGELAGTIGKGIETGKGLLDVVDIVGPLIGKDTSKIRAAGDKGIEMASEGQAKLFDIGSGLGKSGAILQGLGL